MVVNQYSLPLSFGAESDEGGYLFLIDGYFPEISRNHGFNKWKIRDNYENFDQVSRAYTLNWLGQTDIQQLAKRFTLFVKKQNIKLFKYQLDQVDQEDYCSLDSLPLIDLEQVKCDIDSCFEILTGMLPGIPNLYKPPVIYSILNSIDENNIIELPIAETEILHFIRNYPGLQVLVVRDEFSNSDLSLKVAVPQGFYVHSKMFSTQASDNKYDCYATLVKGQKSGGFIHLLIIQKREETIVKTKNYKEYTEVNLSNAGSQNTVFVFSFVSAQEYLFPSDNVIEKIFGVIIKNLHSEVNVCETQVNQCDEVKPSQFLKQLMKGNSFSVLEQEIPQLNPNAQVPIKLILEDEFSEFILQSEERMSISEEFTQLFDNGLFFMNLKILPKYKSIKIQAIVYEEVQCDGIEFHFQGFSGAFLTTFKESHPSINILTVMKTTQNTKRVFSVSHYNIYEKFLDFQQVDNIYIMSFVCNEGPIKDARAKEIFKTFVHTIQTVIIKSESKFFRDYKQKVLEGCFMQQTKRTNQLASKKTPFKEVQKITDQPGEKPPKPPSQSQEIPDEDFEAAETYQTVQTNQKKGLITQEAFETDEDEIFVNIQSESLQQPNSDKQNQSMNTENEIDQFYGEVVNGSQDDEIGVQDNEELILEPSSDQNGNQILEDEDENQKSPEQNNDESDEQFLQDQTEILDENNDEDQQYSQKSDQNEDEQTQTINDQESGQQQQNDQTEDKQSSDDLNQSGSEELQPTSDATDQQSLEGNEENIQDEIDQGNVQQTQYTENRKDIADEQNDEQINFQDDQPPQNYQVKQQEEIIETYSYVPVPDEQEDQQQDAQQQQFEQQQNENLEAEQQENEQGVQQEDQEYTEKQEQQEDKQQDKQESKEQDYQKIEQQEQQVIRNEDVEAPPPIEQYQAKDLEQVENTETIIEQSKESNEKNDLTEKTTKEDTCENFFSDDYKKNSNKQQKSNEDQEEVYYAEQIPEINKEQIDESEYNLDQDQEEIYNINKNDDFEQQGEQQESAQEQIQQQNEEIYSQEQNDEQPNEVNLKVQGQNLNSEKSQKNEQIREQEYLDEQNQDGSQELLEDQVKQNRNDSLEGESYTQEKLAALINEMLKDMNKQKTSQIQQNKYKLKKNIKEQDEMDIEQADQSEPVSVQQQDEPQSQQNLRGQSNYNTKRDININIVIS